MQNINTIARLNAAQRADLENSRNGTYCVLRNGEILLRSGVSSKVIEDRKEAASFIEKVKGQSSGFVRLIVQGFFKPEQINA